MVVIDGINLDDLYIPRISPYNGTGPTGGDSLTQDLNIWYEVSCHTEPKIMRMRHPPLTFYGLLVR